MNLITVFEFYCHILASSSQSHRVSSCSLTLAAYLSDVGGSVQASLTGCLPCLACKSVAVTSCVPVKAPIISAISSILSIVASLLAVCKPLAVVDHQRETPSRRMLRATSADELSHDHFAISFFQDPFSIISSNSLLNLLGGVAFRKMFLRALAGCCTSLNV